MSAERQSAQGRPGVTPAAPPAPHEAEAVRRMLARARAALRPIENGEEVRDGQSGCAMPR